MAFCSLLHESKERKKRQEKLAQALSLSMFFLFGSNTGGTL
jgi:hypothetical protein